MIHPIRFMGRVLAALPLLFLSSCYYLSQGATLISHQWAARDIEGLLADPSTDPALRAFLEKARSIRRFAIHELGLRDSPNYTTYVKVEGDCLAFVVQAAEADRLVPYLWDYPFFGKMPYQGYYQEADARALAADLAGKGYDVLVRKVDAFSTLGFFKDPLYSFMLRYREARLAELIIHEMAHATVFVNGQSNFNEEFATFVGRKGAALWIERNYGTGSDEVKLEADLRADGATYALQLRNLAMELEMVYSSGKDRDSILALKKERIEAFRHDYDRDYETRFRTPWYRGALPEDLNNAWLELYRLYEGEPELWERAWAAMADGSLKTFVDLVRDQASVEKGDMKAWLAARVAGKS